MFQTKVVGEIKIAILCSVASPSPQKFVLFLR